MKRGIPDRGDILRIDLDPTKGREQRERSGEWVEAIRGEIVEEVLARVRTLLD